MEYDTTRILDDASSFVVCQALGIEVQEKGSRKSILCPVHDDAHFGSCLLTPKGFRCYACGAKGSVFDLVMKTLKVSFREAAGFVADTCGGKKLYSQEESKDNAFLPLSRNEKLLLGFLPDEGKGAGVYSAKRYVISGAPYDPKTEKVLEEVLEEDFSWHSVIGVLCDRNPLMTLMQDDEKTYKELIRNKASEMYVRTLRLSLLMDKPHSEKVEEAWLQRYGDIVGKERLQQALEIRAAALDKIFVRHGGESHTELSYFQEISETEVSPELVRKIPQKVNQETAVPDIPILDAILEGNIKNV